MSDENTVYARTETWQWTPGELRWKGSSLQQRWSGLRLKTDGYASYDAREEWRDVPTEPGND